MYTHTQIYIKKRSSVYWTTYKNVSVYSNICTLLIPLTGCTCVHSVSFKNWDQQPFSPGQLAVHSDLPHELQAKSLLNVEPKLSTVEEICLMVHSEKALNNCFLFPFVIQCLKSHLFSWDLADAGWWMWDSESASHVSDCNKWGMLISHKIYIKDGSILANAICLLNI